MAYPEFVDVDSAWVRCEDVEYITAAPDTSGLGVLSRISLRSGRFVDSPLEADEVMERLVVQSVRGDHKLV